MTANDEVVRERVASRLMAELSDDAVATQVAAKLDDRAVRVLAVEEDLQTSELLRFDAPIEASPEALVVFAFGNRIAGDETLSAGPVNLALASLADEWASRSGLPVLAQWEVADEMSASAHRIGVVEHDDGSVEYLSTIGVADQAIAMLSAGAGAVALLAMADHAVRCCQMIERAGVRAGVPAGMALPTRYDADSGQPWTRNRATYVAIDILARCLLR